MAVWAIADLHLSFGIEGKEMHVFGEKWRNHPQKIEEQWNDIVGTEDLVLIPGDISWGMKLTEALPDLEWIHSLKGTKVMTRGNHDYWWSAISKVRAALPESIHVIQNDSFRWQDFEIGGARLWDSEFSYSDYIPLIENPHEDKRVSAIHGDEEERKKIYLRELQRLEVSLRSFQEVSTHKIVMTHYPPVDAEMNPSPVSDLLEDFDVSTCVFGHLHNVIPGSLQFGTARGVHYFYTACEYLDFIPKKIV